MNDDEEDRHLREYEDWRAECEQEQWEEEKRFDPDNAFWLEEIQNDRTI